MSKCGCPCECHTGENNEEWPGPCAGCCDPELGLYACDCTRAITAAFMRKNREYEDALLDIERFTKPLSLYADGTNAFLSSSHLTSRVHNRVREVFGDSPLRWHEDSNVVRSQRNPGSS